MKSERIEQMVFLIFMVVCTCLFGVAFASGDSPVQGIGAVANTAKLNLANVALLITAGSYVAGMGFGVAALAKFKAHKDNAAQVPIGGPIALLFISAALLFVPAVFKSTGATLFDSGQKAGISGTVSF